ncbi:unnamed protein product, partial [Didymodactylos carnosus]
IKHCSANNTPSVSPCSSPTVPKKEMTFTKLTNYVVKTDHPSHHRNSAQNNSLTDQHPYSIASYVSPTSATPSSSASSSSTIINNGATKNHSYHSHFHQQRQLSVHNTSTSTTSNPVQMNHTSPLQQQQYNNENQLLTATTSPIQQQSSNNNILSPSNNNNSNILSPHIPITSNQSINSQPTTPQTPNSNQWRHKLNNLKQSFQSVGTPRFHRRPKIP